jgi:DNA-binding transcriptional ArsR family regulator
VPRDHLAADNPETVWAALAPELAGQPRVRISRDGGRSYPQRHERELTPALPSQPAAVRIFGKDGTCRTICLDFDSSVDGVDRVAADVYRVTSWLHEHGARWIEDHSPNGGRHVYIPLEHRVTFTEAREFVEALGSRYRSLDRSPHQNISHGCIRTPGSPHKSGGHQELAMSLTMAYDIVRRPNSPAVWERMATDLAPEMAAARALRLEEPEHSLTGPAAQLPDAATGTGRMSRTMLAAAVDGLYDTSRYATPSEARQAVLTAAAGCGMSLTDVERRMKQGIWPGLAQFYARYRAHQRFTALRRDWDKAVKFIADKQRKDDAHKTNTSRPNTQGGQLLGGLPESPHSEHRFIRTWRNALSLAEERYRGSRAGMAQRMILRALGAAAHMTGSRFIEFGVRSLAVASGVEHTTVAAHLRALREENDPLVVLVSQGRGTHGDLYCLNLPESLQEAAENRAWDRGKLHSLRPVFRELGMPAAFVYEALEQSSGPLSTSDLVRHTGLSRTAVTEALETLAAWNLSERSGRDLSWRLVAATSLRQLAELFGVLDEVAKQLDRYRAQRALWRQWLSERLTTGAVLPSPGDDYPWETFEGPPDDWTLADMAFKIPA